MALQQQLEEYFDRLWPICRSITGDGLRKSFAILQEIIPLTLHEVSSGTKVFDWVIPDEWNIREAWIETPAGERVADFSVNNLHVLNYSDPVDRYVTYQELKDHVRTLPNQPNAIPYVTSYYNRKWGFCMSHDTWKSLPKKGEYRVYIDSELKSGCMAQITGIPRFRLQHFSRTFNGIHRDIVTFVDDFFGFIEYVIVSLRHLL